MGIWYPLQWQDGLGAPNNFLEYQPVITDSFMMEFVHFD